MNMAGRDKLDSRMTLDDRRERICIEQILTVHMPDAGPERRMMQEKECRPLGHRRQLGIEPFKRRGVQPPVYFVSPPVPPKGS